MATRKPVTGRAADQEAVGEAPPPETPAGEAAARKAAAREVPAREVTDLPGGSGSYEAARDALAGIVGALEAGGLPLEESLALWERGERLAEECERWLAGARERLERGRVPASEPDLD